MRDEEVPQDEGVQGKLRRVNYAVDAAGGYSLVPSLGCDTVNVTNSQEWQQIQREVGHAVDRVRAGEVSPLAIHMAAAQMDVALLGGYVGLSRRRVRRHLKPRVFAALDRSVLERYARVLGVSVEQLRSAEAPRLPSP